MVRELRERRRELGLVLAVVAAFVCLGLAPGVVAAVDDPVTIDVTVVDDDGDPVSGVELTVAWDDDETVEETRANGRALVDVPAGADLEIRVDHPDYVRNQPFTVTNATAQAVEVPVRLSGVAELTVLEGEQPVPDTQLVVRETDGPIVAELTTDAAGVAETPRLERGSYEVTTERTGYFEETVALELTQQQVEQSIVIESGRVTVSFTVLDNHFDHPEPIEGATIETGGTVLETGSDGQRAVDLDVNSVQNVTVDKDGYVEVSRQLVVGETEREFEISTTREPSLNLVSDQQRVVLGEQVRVTATNAYNEPVAGATIRLGDETVGETDANGQLLVEISEPGDRTIRAQDSFLRAETTVEGIDPDSDPDGNGPENGDDGATGDGDTDQNGDTGEQDPETGEDDDDDGPGFGIVIAVGAVAVLLAGRYL